MNSIRTALFGVAATAVCAASVALAAPAVAAPAVPFTDPSASGAITLCDKSGHEVRSGSTLTAPFAWLAVASTAAPAGYGAPTGRATLYAYQPVRNVNPGDWSGQQLTASSTFTNSAHPMASGTVLDSAMGDFVGAFPPQWSGLVQLRMAFSAPQKSAYNDTYPTAVLQITGKTWTLVQGGGGPCTAGSASSTEFKALPSRAFSRALRQTPPSDVHHPGSSSSATVASQSPGASATGSGTPSSSVDAPSSAAAAQQKGFSGGSPAWLWIVVAIVVVVGGAGGSYVYLRRRSAP